MSIDDYPEDIVGVYPDNWLAFEVFASMQTQLRMGMAGPIGFDYSVLPFVFKMRGVKKSDRPEMFELLRVMESEALAVIHAKDDSNG